MDIIVNLLIAGLLPVLIHKIEPMTNNAIALNKPAI